MLDNQRLFLRQTRFKVDVHNPFDSLQMATTLVTMNETAQFSELIMRLALFDQITDLDFLPVEGQYRAIECAT